MSLSLVTAPPALPVTLAEAKAHLRVDHTDEDDYISGLIAAAVSNIDGDAGWLNRALVQQTWDLYLDNFPCREHETDLKKKYGINVPLPPLRSVDAIVYVDASGSEATLSPSAYSVLAGERGIIVPAYGYSWPGTRCQPDAVRIRFTAGYAAGAGSPTDYAENVPAPIKHGLLFLIAHLYENRAPVNIGNITSTLPFTVDALLTPYRVWA